MSGRKPSCIHCTNYDCTYVVPNETDNQWVVDDDFRIVLAKDYQDSFGDKGECGYLKRVMRIHFATKDQAVRHRAHLLDRAIKEAQCVIFRLENIRQQIENDLYK